MSSTAIFLPDSMLRNTRPASVLQMRGSRRLLGESEDTWSLEGASSATSGWRLYSVLVYPSLGCNCLCVILHKNK